MGDLFDFHQSAIDKVRGKGAPLPPIAAPAKAETVSSISSASGSLRAKKRKGLAASILAGQEGTKKQTLG